jgi:pimeloyl-ACP methyl ester carboxylesterase
VQLLSTRGAPPQPIRSPRRGSTTRRLIATVVAAFALVAGSVVAAPVAHASNPYERGPNPTDALVEARLGPFTTSSTRVSSLVSGFGGGRIYYPVTTSQGTFGGIAISPGYTARWSSIDWLGPFLASHGFVVIGINTNSLYDQPGSRGLQLQAALNYLVNSSSERHRVDPDRLAVAGHSMGGGGAMSAVRSNPDLLAAVPLTPWHLSSSFGSVQAATMIIGGQNDTIAPVFSHAIPIYNSVPASSQKAYLEMRREGHFFPTSYDTTVGKYMVSWLKRFVDSDTRYTQFLCPPPRTGLFTPFSDYRDTCPH